MAPYIVRIYFYIKNLMILVSSPAFLFCMIQFVYRKNAIADFGVTRQNLSFPDTATVMVKQFPLKRTSFKNENYDKSLIEIHENLDFFKSSKEIFAIISSHEQSNSNKNCLHVFNDDVPY